MLPGQVESPADEIGNKRRCPLNAQQTRIDAQVVALRMSPLLACIVIVIRCPVVFLMSDVFACSGSVPTMPLAHTLNALVHVGRDENVDRVLVVAQHIVGSSSHEHTVPLVGSLAYRVALEEIEILLGEIVLIEIVIAQQRHVDMEQRFQEALLLIILFKELLTEPALLGRKIQQLLVVEGTFELVGQLLGNDSPTRSDLAADVNNHFGFIHDVVMLIADGISS